MQPKSSSNVIGRRRVDREMGIRSEGQKHFSEPDSNNFYNSDNVNKGSTVGLVTPRDRVIYVSTCLIGHSVEVHVKDGSIISGIFHTTDVGRDFGIVLKMAQIVKDGSLKGQPVISDTVKKPQTMIVSGKELVQVIAKDMSLTGDEFSNNVMHDKVPDLMVDSAISQSHRVEERQLEPWMADNDDPLCPELDNIFDGKWNRSWDQFQINEKLFGVKSTFDEEIYTTKLEKGPQMREREREAARIAREIEEDYADDRHLTAFERGAGFPQDFEIDEETKFSAVYRVVDDYTYGRNNDTIFDTHNAQNSGGSLDSVDSSSFPDISEQKKDDVAQISSCSSHMNEVASHSVVKEVQDPNSFDQERKPPSKMNPNHFISLDRVSNVADCHAKKIVFDNVSLSKAEEKHSTPDASSSSFDDDKVSLNATESPCQVEEKKNDYVSLEYANSGIKLSAALSVNSFQNPPSSTIPTSKVVNPKSVPIGSGLSPSSSVGSLSSEKSTLNPYAKEFKFNPHAKNFTPLSSMRPQSPVSESSIYYGTNSAVPYMPVGLAMGAGIGQTFSGDQSIVYTQGVNMQSPQAYMHSNTPLYGQQIYFSQPRPVMHMPVYSPEMQQYKGREF